VMLSRFRWYRRMRGGYWGQVTAPLGIFSRTRWVRVDAPQPLPDGRWEFYPWASKTMGNGYMDEWHGQDPCYVVPLSQVICDDCKERLAK
jgi:hypothetical protein